MGSYVPHTPSQRQAMLETVGAERMEDLFAAVPREMMVGESLRLPAGKSELEVRRAVASSSSLIHS